MTGRPVIPLACTCWTEEAAVVERTPAFPPPDQNHSQTCIFGDLLSGAAPTLHPDLRSGCEGAPRPPVNALP